MKKILFLINDLQHGGAEKALVNLVNNMDYSNYDITVMTLFDVGVNKSLLFSHVRYKYVFKRIFRGNSYIFKVFSPDFLYKFMIKDKYDIVVSYLEGITARIVSGNTSICKTISWQHSGTYNLEKLVKPAFRNEKEMLKAYQSFDRIVGVSENVIDSFSSLTQITSNTCVINNVIERDKVISKSKEEIEINYNKEVFNIVSVGRLTKLKGYDRLLRIINQINKKKSVQKKINLHIIGCGEEQKNLERYIDSHNLQKIVFLHGYQKNPFPFVLNSDLFICSSLIEGISTAVSEALILGVPVITTNCSGMKELLGENLYGIITENDEQSLYVGLVKLLNAPSTIIKLKEAAKERGKLFGVGKVVKEVQVLLDTI